MSNRVPPWTPQWRRSLKPAYNVADLLVQHLVALKQDAQAKGGIQQFLDEHFTKVYKAELSINLTA